MNSIPKITTARKESVRPEGHQSHGFSVMAAVQVSILSLPRDWLLAELSIQKWDTAQHFVSSKKC